MGMLSPGRIRAAIVLGLCAGAGGLVFLATRGVPPPAPAAPVPAAPEAAAAGPQAPAPQPPAPSVDVVRVSPEGDALVAGRAAPGATVTLYTGDQPLATAQADASGNFVAMFEARPSTEPQNLTLGSETPDGTASRSDQVVVLLPAAPATTEPEAATVTGTATETQAAQGSQPASAADGAAPRPPTGPEPRIAATAILSPESAEITPTARPAGVPADQIALASISYADAGSITLAGFGLAGAELRAYVNDALAREGRVASDGRWTLALADIAAGVYRLRIDQLDSHGRVSSRIETPFQRDVPRPRPAGSPDEAPMVVVQPGNSLWALARLRYGSGMLYARIFAANSDLIRDPDLIYPGQIFRMPENPMPEDPARPPAD